MARCSNGSVASFGRIDRDDATMQELQCLRDEAERIGLEVAIPALEQALSSFAQRAGNDLNPV